MSLKAIQFKIHVQQEEDLFLPQFSGSMLRGAFGHSLRKISCITKMKDCNECPLKHNCSYIRIFETEKIFDDIQKFGQAQNPYSLQVAHLENRKINKNERWSFSMTLIGKAIQDLPIVMFAWQKALERGLTHQRVISRLVNITQNEQILYDPNINKIYPAHITELELNTDRSLNRIVLQFDSPVRIKHKGRYILDAQYMNVRQLLLRLLQRVKSYGQQQENTIGLDFERLNESLNQIEGKAIHLEQKKVIRFSNRQKQQIQLEGLTGEYELTGKLDLWLPLLEFGQMIHIGKNATHGLGQYHIKQVS